MCDSDHMSQPSCASAKSHNFSHPPYPFSRPLYNASKRKRRAQLWPNSNPLSLLVHVHPCRGAYLMFDTLPPRGVLSNDLLNSSAGLSPSFHKQSPMPNVSCDYKQTLSSVDPLFPDGHGVVGSLWFGIFLQLALIIGVLYTLASDSIAMHRLQISVFGAVAIVFAVQGANEGLFANIGSLQAMGAGWLVLSMVDILWVLYFTSEDDSLALHIFNSFGTGGLTPPSRRRRSPRGTSVHMTSPGNGYAAPYSTGGGIGPGMYDAKITGNGSFHEPIEPATRSIGGGSITNAPTSTGAGSIRNESTVGSPLMGSGNAGIGAGGGNSPLNSGVPEPVPGTDGTVYRARALYACMSSCRVLWILN
jgi:SHO1 osmosensor